jgi:hypothetical protein
MFTRGEPRGNRISISMDFSTAEPLVQGNRPTSRAGSCQAAICSDFITMMSRIPVAWLR